MEGLIQQVTRTEFNKELNLEGRAVHYDGAASLGTQVQRLQGYFLVKTVEAGQVEVVDWTGRTYSITVEQAQSAIDFELLTQVGPAPIPPEEEEDTTVVEEQPEEGEDPPIAGEQPTEETEPVVAPQEPEEQPEEVVAPQEGEDPPAGDAAAPVEEEGV